MSKLRDLTGQKFGRLYVIERSFKGNSEKTMWKCQCDCGNVVNVAGHSLTSGNTKSCGCLRSEIASSRMAKVTIGQKYGRLTVEREMPRREKPCGAKLRIFQCRCDCGNLINVASVNLLSGNTKSCGCLKSEIDHTRFKTHGLSMHEGKKSRLYSIWVMMKSRCDNPHNKDFKYYGGRGIRVCSEWDSNYLSFYTWAMNAGYDPSAEQGQCTIDRTDNNGNYCPENCRWVSMKVQTNNRRKTASETVADLKDTLRKEYGVDINF